MTAAVAAGRPRAAPVNAGFAAAMVGLGAAALIGQEQVRRTEAMGSAGLLNLLRVAPAASLGTAVTFPAKGRYVGFTIAPGCTVALLVVPFFLVAGVLLLAGRVQPGRATATVAIFTLLVSVVNQLRLLVIAVSMRVWGFPAGFDRSHVLLGTLVSTIGVVGGLLLFLRMVLPSPESGRRG